MHRALPFLLLPVLLIGCDDPTAPRDVRPGDLTFTLTVDPIVVAPGASFTARLEITNTAVARVRMRFDCDRDAFLVVDPGPESITLPGSNNSCQGAHQFATIHPGESRTTTWTLRADRSPGVPLDPGEYALHAIPLLPWEVEVSESFLVD
jgi:hypothetical protein